MVVVVLLLLVEDLQLQEELLLLEDLGVGRVQLGRRLLVSLLVGGDVLVVLELLHLVEQTRLEGVNGHRLSAPSQV